MQPVNQQTSNSYDQLDMVNPMGNQEIEDVPTEIPFHELEDSELMSQMMEVLDGQNEEEEFAYDNFENYE